MQGPGRWRSYSCAPASSQHFRRPLRAEEGLLSLLLLLLGLELRSHRAGSCGYRLLLSLVERLAHLWMKRGEIVDGRGAGEGQAPGSRTSLRRELRKLAAACETGGSSSAVEAAAAAAAGAAPAAALAFRSFLIARI